MKNNLVFDMKKAWYAYFFWDNGKGSTRKNKPGYTVNGSDIDPFALALEHPDYPGEGLLTRAMRLGILDHWVSCVRFQFSTYNSLTFRGDKATELWDAW